MAVLPYKRRGKAGKWTCQGSATFALRTTWDQTRSCSAPQGKRLGDSIDESVNAVIVPAYH